MSANDRQVAGSHYRGDYQHWDFVNDTRMGYHAGNATKYIARHRKKHGTEDLKKALHYIEKLREMQEAAEAKTRQETSSLTQVVQGEARRGYYMLEVDLTMAILKFGHANYLTATEIAAIGAVVLRNWDSAVMFVNELIKKAPEGVASDA